MKKLLLIYVLTAFWSHTALAGPSLYFDTVTGTTSWTFTGEDGTYIMSFDNIYVTLTDPAGDNVINDFIGLPDMTLSDIGISKGFVVGTLTPVSQLTITDDVTSQEVMTADLGADSLMKIGAGFSVFYIEESDLTNIDGMDGESVVIDSFIEVDSLEDLFVDLYFTGSTFDTLFDNLEVVANGENVDFTVSGVLSGYISQGGVAHTPAPGAVLLGSIGMGLIGFAPKTKNVVTFHCF
ncbi:MAG: hypothetical protein ACYS9Y_04665 [Planctomycetota bacterium]